MEKKTGIIVTAWNEDFTTQHLDISELKPGMMVRELGGLIKITGSTVDDDEDYMICTEKGYYSALLIDTDRTKIQASPEREQKIDFISIDDNGHEHKYSLTPEELANTWNFDYYNLPNVTDLISECVFGGTHLYFCEFIDLVRTFLG